MAGAINETPREDTLELVGIDDEAHVYGLLRRLYAAGMSVWASEADDDPAGEAAPWAAYLETAEAEDPA